MAPPINAGKLRGLAQTGERRSHVVPQLPTLGELGIRGAEMSGWYGLYAPAKTPKEKKKKDKKKSHAENRYARTLVSARVGGADREGRRSQWRGSRKERARPGDARRTRHPAAPAVQSALCRARRAFEAHGRGQGGHARAVAHEPDGVLGAARIRAEALAGVQRRVRGCASQVSRTVSSAWRWCRCRRPRSRCRKSSARQSCPASAACTWRRTSTARTSTRRSSFPSTRSARSWAADFPAPGRAGRRRAHAQIPSGKFSRAIPMKPESRPRRSCSAA